MTVLPCAPDVGVEGSYSLIPLDQPAWLGDMVRTFHQEVSHARAR